MCARGVLNDILYGVVSLVEVPQDPVAAQTCELTAHTGSTDDSRIINIANV